MCSISYVSLCKDGTKKQLIRFDKEGERKSIKSNIDDFNKCVIWSVLEIRVIY